MTVPVHLTPEQFMILYRETKMRHYTLRMSVASLKRPGNDQKLVTLLEDREKQLKALTPIVDLMSIQYEQMKSINLVK